MSLKLDGQLFTGPFPIETTVVRSNKIPVVFAIIAKCGPSWSPRFRVIDVGASPDEGLNLATHPRRSDWREEPGDVVGAYFLYLPRSEANQEARQQLAQKLQELYAPPNNYVK